MSPTKFTSVVSSPPKCVALMKHWFGKRNYKIHPVLNNSLGGLWVLPFGVQMRVSRIDFRFQFSHPQRQHQSITLAKATAIDDSISAIITV
jgi:hypothetical protein